MIGPDFLLFSKLIEIVFLAILLVIFVKRFWSKSFRLPQWVVCLHTTFGNHKRWNHISPIGSCIMLPINTVFSILYNKVQLSSNTVGRSWQNSHAVIIILNIFPLSFLLPEYPTSMFDPPSSYHAWQPWNDCCCWHKKFAGYFRINYFNKINI